MHKVLLLAVTALCAACTSTSLSANKEKECAAIESTIERFLQAHAARDYETWGHAWVQKPYVTFSALAPQYNYYDCGWTNLYNAQKRYFMAEEKLDQERGTGCPSMRAKPITMFFACSGCNSQNSRSSTVL